MAEGLDKALEDINWLSNRLSGLVEVSKEIQDYSSLKSQTKEMSSILEKQKADYKKLQEAYKKALEDVNLAAEQKDQEIFDMENLKKHMSDEAKKEADYVVAKANVEASEIVARAEDQKEMVLAETQKAEEYLKHVHEQIAEAEEKLETANKALNKLKSKL